MTASIGEKIRSAAEQKGLSIESFRRRHRFPNTVFYGLLADRLPAKVSTRAEWKKRLERAGIEVGETF